MGNETFDPEAPLNSTEDGTGAAKDAASSGASKFYEK